MKHQPQDSKANANSKFARNRGSKESIPPSAGKIKKKIRDTQRTISRKDVPADVLTEAKRRLRVLEFDLGEKIIDDHERDNASKYHKVKHFERKKVERKLKQAKKAFEDASKKSDAEPAKIAELQEKVKEMEIKLLYTKNYPKTLPYISLFPQANENDTKSLTRKTKLLEEIKQAVADGDKELTMLQKRYRDVYKEKLIERKVIQPVAPVDIEEMQVDAKKEDDGNSSSDSDDNQDDFFEKA
ncbi:biotin holocarboxylase synthetase [Mucor velutinosus]|uniref:rRNA-processing protein EFG1 n=1 Tax=Mucor velutinosus TaxID=708070 RepID=A0AAN7I4F9_9FUNG|nr:biotin holocarboxylase synthetase [Mucor velutinosus]